MPGRPQLLAAGTALTVDATDDIQRVRCTSDAGEVLWLRLNPERNYELETPAGFILAWEAMDGLCFAG